MQKKKRLDAYRPLPPFTVERLHEDLRVLLTYHFNAIEGNTLSLTVTQMVLAYGITVNRHPLREFLEATNHAQTFDALSRLAAGLITGDTVLILHRLGMLSMYLPIRQAATTLCARSLREKEELSPLLPERCATRKILFHRWLYECMFSVGGTYLPGLHF